MTEPLNMPSVGIPTFCRLPICTDLAKLDADIAFLGVPYDGGGNFRPGMRFGPRHIREMSMRHAYRYGSRTGFYDFETDQRFLVDEVLNNRLWDCGDVDIVYTKTEQTFDNITRGVGTILSRGAFPVIFGGDHSISYPALRAYKKGPVDVVVIDAHLDFTDVVAGVTLGGGNPFRRATELGTLGKIVHIGIRGLRNSPQVRAEAIANGNVIVTTKDVRDKGVEQCLRAALPLKNVYLSVDVDGLDPSIAPGCSGSDPGGLYYEEALNIIEFVTSHANVVGYDITEVNPTIDPSDITAGLAAALTLQFLRCASLSPHWKARGGLS
jgi:agmatinase